MRDIVKGMISSSARNRVTNVQCFYDIKRQSIICHCPFDAGVSLDVVRHFRWSRIVLSLRRFSFLIARAVRMIAGTDPAAKALTRQIRRHSLPSRRINPLHSFTSFPATPDQGHPLLGRRILSLPPVHTSLAPRIGPVRPQISPHLTAHPRRRTRAPLAP